MSSDNTTHSMPSVLKFKYPKKQRQLITNHRKRQMSVFAYILRRTNQEPVATGNIYRKRSREDNERKVYLTASSHGSGKVSAQKLMRDVGVHKM